MRVRSGIRVAIAAGVLALSAPVYADDIVTPDPAAASIAAPEPVGEIQSRAPKQADDKTARKAARDDAADAEPAKPKRHRHAKAKKAEDRLAETSRKLKRTHDAVAVELAPDDVKPEPPIREHGGARRSANGDLEPKKRSAASSLDAASPNSARRPEPREVDKAAEAMPLPTDTPGVAAAPAQPEAASAETPDAHQPMATPWSSPSTAPLPTTDPQRQAGAEKPASKSAAEVASNEAPRATGSGSIGEDLRKLERQDLALANEGASAETPRQVLIVLAKPEVKIAADLQDKSVLVTGVDSLSKRQIEASFAAAGARELSFKQSAAGDASLLWSGKVSAAVVAVAEPDIAAGFHEIPGYRVLLVQVSPSQGR